jgi:hypothetical protein
MSRSIRSGARRGAPSGAGRQTPPVASPLAARAATAARTAGTILGTAVGVAAIQAISDLYRTDNTLQDQNVIFPSDLKDAYIHMRFSKYERRSIRERPFFSPQNSIKLPIPREITDNISVSYSQAELGSILGSVLDNTQRNSFSPETLLSNQGPLNIQNLLGDTGEGASARALRFALGDSSFTNILGGSPLDALSAASGISINPYQTILFKSPNFKKHRFSWRLVPKNEQESRNIEYILRLFKYHMLPGTLTSSSVFFTYPEILQIRIYPNDDFLYKFKPCVVESMSANYAPNEPSFYKTTGAPTAVDFTISLQEIEIWTKQDYNRNIAGRIDTTPTLNLRPGNQVEGQ